MSAFNRNLSTIKPPPPGDLAAFQDIERLQKQDFDINMTDKRGATYLSAASMHGQAKIVANLLGKGAVVDKPDKDGMTALWAAVVHNHVDAVRLLLKKGADPNIQPYNQNKQACPLFMAAYNNNPEVCEFLLNFGANIDKKFEGSQNLPASALQIAIQEKHTKINKMLQAATDEKMEEKRKKVIANVAKARIEQEKKEKVRAATAKKREEKQKNGVKSGANEAPVELTRSALHQLLILQFLLMLLRLLRRMLLRMLLRWIY